MSYAHHGISDKNVRGILDHRLAGVILNTYDGHEIAFTGASLGVMCHTHKQILGCYNPTTKQVDYLVEKCPVDVETDDDDDEPTWTEQTREDRRDVQRAW